jgi:uncharacterized protein YbbC (DUF1343 family)
MPAISRRALLTALATLATTACGAYVAMPTPTLSGSAVTRLSPVASAGPANPADATAAPLRVAIPSSTADISPRGTAEPALATATSSAMAGKTTTVRPGIDVLLDGRLDLVAGKRLGLITNPTGITVSGVSDVDALHGHRDVRLVALFGPEHGIRGDAADGAPVASTTDAKTGLPIYSLYGETRRPTAAMLANVDVLVFDIQDVGARYYTFASTMAYAMQAAATHGKRFVVLDRPNPIGGLAVDGPVLEPAQESFVGLYPIALRHGLTMGELAGMFNDAFGIHADLAVVPAAGWRRGLWFDQTGLPWVRPSPNIPDLTTASLYAGVGLIEGTNVAEGRGTAQPFKNVGAPWLDGERWAAALAGLGLPGVEFRPTRFTPTVDKYRGVPCGGVLMNLTDRQRFRPVDTGLNLIATAQQLASKKFAWDDGFRLMVGNTWVQQRLDADTPVPDLIKAWQPALSDFLALRRKYLLYPD